MNTFKQSAIEILKKAGTPLHYTEITRLALESGILETEGATPEASMNAQITVDIKTKAKALILSKPRPELLLSIQTRKKSKKRQKSEKPKKRKKKKLLLPEDLPEKLASIWFARNCFFVVSMPVS